MEYPLHATQSIRCWVTKSLVCKSNIPKETRSWLILLATSQDPPPPAGDDQTCIQASTPKERIQNRDPQLLVPCWRILSPKERKEVQSPGEATVSRQELVNNLIPLECEH